MCVAYWEPYARKVLWWVVEGPTCSVHEYSTAYGVWHPFLPLVKVCRLFDTCGAVLRSTFGSAFALGCGAAGHKGKDTLGADAAGAAAAAVSVRVVEGKGNFGLEVGECALCPWDGKGMDVEDV